MPFEIEPHVAAIERDGDTLIEDFLDAPTLAEVRRVLAFSLGNHSGRNDFEGLRAPRARVDRGGAP